MTTNSNLGDRLRALAGAIAPSEEFADRVAAGIDRLPRPRVRRRRWLTRMAGAASLLAIVFVVACLIRVGPSQKPTNPARSEGREILLALDDNRNEQLSESDSKSSQYEEPIAPKLPLATPLSIAGARIDSSEALPLGILTDSEARVAKSGADRDVKSRTPLRSENPTVWSRELGLIVIQNDPGSLSEFRSREEPLYFSVTGNTAGAAWGSDVYTDDSSLATAAVHAGALEMGESGVVVVTILPGRDSYTGSSRNGVTTREYGEYPGSFRVQRIPQGAKPEVSPAAEVLPDPVSLTAYRGQMGKAFLFRVTGRTAVPHVGPIPADGESYQPGDYVWGSDIYTDDSTLALAAVHAGVLQDGQTGIVKVTILPGRDSYSGSTRNGVTTHDYGPWPGSYWVESAPQVAKPAVSPAAEVLPDPVSLTAHRGEVGKAFLFRVTGRSDVLALSGGLDPTAPGSGGSVWGTDVYTDDSTLAVAAVHAGVLQLGQPGIVKVTILPGRDSYAGSTRNGVTTSDYGPWAGSYWIEKGPESPAPTAAIAPSVSPGVPLAVNVQPDPGSIARFRAEPMYFRVTGNTTGSVWGSDVYTDDSSLATAAVHAGALRDGETGVIKVTLLPGQAKYAGTSRHGVTTREYGEYPGSFRVERAREVAEKTPSSAGSTAALADPGTLFSHRGEVGKIFFFRVTGSTAGVVWGSDVYTDDSTLAVAAVHTGALRDGQTGVVKVIILPGRDTYAGSTKNGVTTSAWESHPGSYRVERHPQLEDADVERFPQIRNRLREGRTIETLPQ